MSMLLFAVARMEEYLQRIGRTSCVSDKIILRQFFLSVSMTIMMCSSRRSLSPIAQEMLLRVYGKSVMGVEQKSCFEKSLDYCYE